MLETDRLLRELAVDLIRASDLYPALALYRAERVRDSLDVVLASLRGSVRAGSGLVRAAETVERIKAA